MHANKLFQSTTPP